jgi:phenylacetate-CoA ligase
MVLVAELKEDVDEPGRLTDDINKKFQDMCRLKIDKIEFVAPGAIPADHKTMSDQRTWD